MAAAVDLFSDVPFQTADKRFIRRGWVTIAAPGDLKDDLANKNPTHIHIMVNRNTADLVAMADQLALITRPAGQVLYFLMHDVTYGVYVDRIRYRDLPHMTGLEALKLCPAV